MYFNLVAGFGESGTQKELHGVIDINFSSRRFRAIIQ